MKKRVPNTPRGMGPRASCKIPTISEVQIRKRELSRSFIRNGESPIRVRASVPLAFSNQRSTPLGFGYQPKPSEEGDRRRRTAGKKDAPAEVAPVVVEGAPEILEVEEAPKLVVKSRRDKPMVKSKKRGAEAQKPKKAPRKPPQEAAEKPVVPAEAEPRTIDMNMLVEPAADHQMVD